MQLQQVHYRSKTEETCQITPSKVVCVGRNYVDHIHELANEIPEQMVLFVKPNSAISSQLKSVHQEPLHYEAELCFMVKNGALHAVGVGLDLTKRQLQSELKAKSLPWERAKSFDGSALFSQFVDLSIELDGGLNEGLDSLSFTLQINGELRQQGDVSLMMNKPQAILAEISEFMTLIDGDIIMTGTPKGVGVIQAKDELTLSLFSQNTLLTQVSWVAS
ncbi:fumarylacetoacetate hydrolase family protein [Shewanella sp. AS1]|uniref:fumarylacetoacetate hydrolase family protein n=1 Tax=Shewanella sp. AS1 TaxID=2907626 RepID=UPI001F3B4F58|nr:fumarylacetoacetate hydrolase family protein [Shewanella sp. AS1]MCE9678304.1 fumarylacetoacetate hydrolase family protein [Shewanella sp. AS1]